jgi:hypothetical protein
MAARVCTLLVRRLLCLAICWLVFACGSGPRGPNLVEISELGPRHVEVGDRVRVTGSGFPEGRPATLTLRGELLRAGDAPRSDVTLTAPALLVAPHALEFTVTRELAAALCGAPAQRHSTFRGDVEVAFSPQTSAGTPVIGRLDGVVLDVMPELSAEEASRALSADGARFAQFLGLQGVPSEDGLRIAAVEPQSRAARAGLTDGDVVLSVDGVIVRGLSDFIPPPNAKSSLLVIRRGPDQLPVRVDASGFRYSAPETLLPALVLVGAVVLSFLLLFSPFGRGIAFFERRLCERLWQRRAFVASRRSALPKAFVRALADELPDTFLPYVALVASSALLALLSLGKSLVVAELDLLVVPAGTLSGLLLTALFSGGADGVWSFRRGLSRALALLLLNFPLAALVLGAAFWAGSLRPSDIVGLQGAWPWQWAAFRSPLLGVLGLLALVALVPAVRPAPVLPRRVELTRWQRILDLVAWVHQLSATGIIALIVFGGFQAPLSGSSTFALIVGALLSLAKAWLLIAGIALLRWALGGIDVMSVRRAVLIGLVVPSALSLAISLALRAVSVGPVLGTLESTLAPMLCATLVVLLSWVGRRVAHILVQPNPDLGVQPWL